MTCFWLYICTAVVFLFVVSCQGVLNCTNRETIRHRYKYDAIEYYQEDIEWTTFNFVMLVNNLENLHSEWRKSSLETYEDYMDVSFENDGALLTFLFLSVARLYTFCVIGKLRDS